MLTGSCVYLLFKLNLSEGESFWFCDGKIGDFNTTEPDR